MSKTILYFLDDPSRDKHFQDYVLSGLEEAGYEPIVTYFWMGCQESQLKKLGHKTLNLGCTRESYKGFHPGLVLKIRDALKKYNAVGAHVQRHHPLTYVAVAAHLTQLRALFYTIRSTRLLRNFNRKLVFRLICPKITRIISVSQGVKDDFIQRSRVPEEMIEVIPNGIDPSAFALQVDKKEVRRTFHLPEDAFLFGMVARLKKAKDHRGLIHAFSRINEKGASACLVLVGDGPLENELKALVRVKKLEENVIFLGKLPPQEISLILKAFDVFVHPSWREGMPAAILEAMASGLPVIATDAEGVSDIFETHRTIGRLVRRGDVDLLAEAMEELYLASPTERKDMGQQARARVDDAFTHTHMVEKTVALYNRFFGA